MCKAQARFIEMQEKKYETKSKSLTMAKEKHQIIYKGIPIRLTADFSAETLQARREWGNFFFKLSTKNMTLVKLSSKSEGKIVFPI
jgi:hypothetical protein